MTSEGVAKLDIGLRRRAYCSASLNSVAAPMVKPSTCNGGAQSRPLHQQCHITCRTARTGIDARRLLRMLKPKINETDVSTARRVRKRPPASSPRAILSTKSTRAGCLKYAVFTKQCKADQVKLIYSTNDRVRPSQGLRMITEQQGLSRLHPVGASMKAASTHVEEVCRSRGTGSHDLIGSADLSQQRGPDFHSVLSSQRPSITCRFLCAAAPDCAMEKGQQSVKMGACIAGVCW